MRQETDQSKTPQEVARALTCLAASTDWAIFPWGGYARYGMLGLVMDAAGPTQIAVPPFFQYAATGDLTTLIEESLPDVLEIVLNLRHRSGVA